MKRNSKRFLWVFVCLNLAVVGYADTLELENESSSSPVPHSALSEGRQDLHFPATSQTRKLPASIAVALQRDILQNPINLSWQGRDTPLHSGDVAKSMLQIPAFSMTRKGGGGSEIAFRAQSASRLPIFLNGGNLNGACGGRMDTTITYVFPENYNRITILKGPQDVRYGALIGGGVLFDREILRLSKSQFAFDSSALYGSFGRFDANVNVLAGGKYGSIRAIYSHYESRDYRSGDNKVVHSAYNRESVSLIGTLTPTQNTALELDIDIGRGNASYADRADARTFDRISYNLAYKQHISDTFDSLEMRVWRNEIDHIMDNFSHRQVMDNKYNVSNPKRTNTGGRVEGTFYFGNAWELYVGGNYNHDFHTSRMLSGSSSKEEANAILNQAYKPNFTFQTLGIFAQGQYMPESSYGIAFGARYDTLSTLQHSTNKELLNHLGSGFLRYEKYFDTLTFYSGMGVAQRGADFWERNKGGGMALKPETNTQLDMGLVYKVDNFNAKVSLYMSHIADYIMLHYGKDKTSAFNTNAFLGGGELEAEYIAWRSLHFYGSLAYTYAENLKSVAGFKANSPLPQVAPLQGQLSVFYDNGGWLLRLDMIAHAAQHRYMLDYGNVIGKDLGKTQGFTTLNLYGGYKRKHFMLLAGVDNLTNTLYAYHLSKNGVGIGDIAPTTRIYEPGRSYWAKIRVYF